jgi:hypothetical protein
MRTLSILILLASAALPCPAEDKPVVPAAYQWLVTPYESVQGATSEFLQASGDPYVIALPTSAVAWPWIVVRRVMAGSVFVDPDAPMRIETFDSLESASLRFATIAADHAPLLVTAKDGKVLVVSLRQAQSPRPRAVRH